MKTTTCDKCGSVIAEVVQEVRDIERKMQKAHPVESGSWVKGEAPLKRVLMLWNGKALFGPIAFQTEEHRDQETQRLIATTASEIAGSPTHYLIIPMAPRK